ncbi:MAG: hypothetical protein ACLUN9_06480 [Enterocloster aldenensis]
MEELVTGAVEKTAPAAQKWYEGVSLEDAEIYIQANLKSAARSVIAIGYYLKCVNRNELFKEAGYKDICEYAKDRFGFSASTTSRYMTRNDKFSVNGNSPILDEKYKDFNKSQLQEMLSLDAEQLEKVTPDMTVVQIREMKRPKEIPYIAIPGQIELTDLPGVEPEDVAAAAQARKEMVAGSPERQAYTISMEDLLPQDEPDSVKETIAISQQDSGPEVIHFTAGDRTIDGAYGATIAAVVRKYLDSGYARPEKECEVAALGLTYKVLKRQDVTVFYTDTGRTVFDVENARLEEEYQYWNRNKGQPEPSGESQTGPEPPRPEQTHPEKSGKCIHRPEFDCTLEEAHKLIPGTGEDCSRVCCWECVKHGDCKLECYSSSRRPVPQEHGKEEPNAVSDCPPGIQDCQRQEWGTKPEEQEAGHKECEKCWASWKRGQNTLGAAEVQREAEDAAEMQQEPEAEKTVDVHPEPDLQGQLPEKIQGPEGENIGGVPVFLLENRMTHGAYGWKRSEIIKGYLQALHREECYTVWNQVPTIQFQVLGDTYMAKYDGFCYVSFKYNGQTMMFVELDRLKAEYAAKYPPKMAKPVATYDKSILQNMIKFEQDQLDMMGPSWIEKQPYHYTKHMMALEAYRMLQEAHEGEENGKVVG